MKVTKSTPEEWEYQKKLREQISAALKRKALEKEQQKAQPPEIDLSDIPFDPPYIIRKRR